MTILILGAGQLSKQATDIFLKNNRKIIGFVDDNVKNYSYRGIPILNNIHNKLHEEFNPKITKLFIAIGDNKVRQDLFNKFKNNFEFDNCVDKNIIKAHNVKIGVNNFVAPFTNIGHNVVIGNGNIINDYAMICHDTTCGDFNSFCPKSCIGAYTKIGDLNFFGSGTFVRTKSKIGANNVVGVQSTVIKNLTNDCIVYGTPAKLKK